MRGGRDLYIFQMAVTGDMKIGRSSDIDRRLGEVQTGCPHKLRVLLRAPNMGHRERDLHQRLRMYRCRMMKGEWFREEGMGEIPIDIYNLIPPEVLEDPDWWKR
jgi:hypothetical protein